MNVTYRLSSSNDAVELEKHPIRLVGYSMKSDDDHQHTTTFSNDDCVRQERCRQKSDAIFQTTMIADNRILPNGRFTAGRDNKAFDLTVDDISSTNNHNLQTTHFTRQNGNCKCNNNYGNGFANSNGGYSTVNDDGSGGGDFQPEPDRMRKCCSRKVLYKRIPALGFWQNYTSDKMISDLIAGITVGLTMIPQAIAYANVAGLPPQYGLYSSFVGCFIYALLGSCKVSSIGPTAILAILIRENIHGYGPEFAVLLAFLTGIVQIIMGLLQLGFLVDFISGPVSVGFTSAAAIVIASTQMKDLLGLTYGASKFLDVWDQLAHHIAETSVPDLLLGLSCMLVLLILRKVKDIHVGPADTKDKSSVQKFLCGFLWFISTGRNILVVVFCTILAYIYKENSHAEPPFKLSEVSVEPGIPEFQLAPFSTKADNRTLDFFDMTSKLGSGIVIVPLLSLLEDISLSKVFCDGKSIDATQELLALGTCNLLSSFASSMPISGGLSRGAINHASGAQTTFGNIYAGIIVMTSLQFLTPYFSYIPKASLAAVIIAAVVFMVEFQVVKPMWRTKKLDLIPAGATFLCCLLLRLEFGIFIGVGINVLFLLYASARPTVQVQKHKNDWGYEYIAITPDRSLQFPSVEYVRNVVSKVGLKQGYSSIPVVIDSRHVHGADFTAAKGIKSLIEDFVKRNQPLLFYNLKPSVVEIFQGVKPSEFVYCQSEQQLHDMLKSYYFKGNQPTTMDKK